MLGRSRVHFQPVHPRQPGRWPYASKSDNIGTPLASFVKALIWFGLCGGLFVVCSLRFLFQVAWWGWAWLPSAWCQVIVASSSGSRSLPVPLEFMYLVSFLLFTHQRFNPAFLLFRCDQTSPVDQLLHHSPPSLQHLCHPSQLLLCEPASCVTVSLHMDH